MRALWCLSVNPRSVYETRYVCHDNRGHLNEIPPISLCVSLLSLLGNGSGKHVPSAMNTRNNRKIVRRACVCGCLLIVARQQLGKDVPAVIVGGVVFYVVRVVSKGSRRLVLPRTYSFRYEATWVEEISLRLIGISLGT
jgi:O-antigen/teichoic acid export membrane protein